MLTLTSQPSLIVTPVRSQSVNRAPRRSATSNRAPRNCSLPPSSPAWNRCGPNCASVGAPGEAGAGPGGSLVAVMDRKIALVPDGLDRTRFQEPWVMGTQNGGEGVSAGVGS